MTHEQRALYFKVYSSIYSLSFPKTFARTCSGIEPESKKMDHQDLSLKKKKEKKFCQIHLEKLQSGGSSAIFTGVKPPAASVLSHPSAIVRDCSDVAPTTRCSSTLRNADNTSLFLFSVKGVGTLHCATNRRQFRRVSGEQSRVFPTHSVRQSV